MNVSEVLIALLSGALLVTGIVAKYRGKKADEANRRNREFEFREQANQIRQEIATLEKKSLDSNTEADNSLADYLSSVPGSKLWRPGKHDNNDERN